MNASSTKKPQVGALSKLGINHMRELPFILPVEYKHISPRLTRFEEIQEGLMNHIVVVLDGDAQWNPKNTKAHYWAELLADQPLKILFQLDKHGFDRQVLKGLVGRCLLHGELRTLAKGPVFEVYSVRPGVKWGQDLVVPVYSPGNTDISSHYLDKRMTEEVAKLIPLSSSFIKRLLSISNKADEDRVMQIVGAGEGWGINHVLRTIHSAPDSEAGEFAKSLLERLSVYTAVVEGKKSCPRPTPDAIFPALTDLNALTNNISFSLTAEQIEAVRDAIEELRSEKPMRRILSGDVGTGKTVVFSIIAASVAMAGGFVMILTPNYLLSRQAEENIKGWYPSLRIGLVSRNNSNLFSPTSRTDYDILIGTTALISRIGEARPDLCIVDEQQKFATSQREFHGAYNLLEATATCIPRSQALVEFGIYTVSRLRECHVKKRFITKIYYRSQRQELFTSIEAVIQRGERVLIVYPRAEELQNEEGNTGLISVESAHKMWEKHFPGRVAWLHGKVDDEQKDAVISQMKSGKKDILVATSVVEVGIDIPDMRLLIVVSADRFGAKEIHQMRGRLARNGGTGYCALLIADEVAKKQKTMERLHILVGTSDGFEVAERNLRLQGFGDLRHQSNAQRGALDGFLPDHKVTYERVSELNLSSSDT
jgi:ATP-dependent DNA helicase RecG